MSVIFKIRDTATGKFWNGDRLCSSFNDTGKSWPKRERAQAAVGSLITYQNHWRRRDAPISPTTWEIVEIEVSEKESATHSLAGYLDFLKIKTACRDVWTADRFLDVLWSKGTVNDVKMMFKLKKAEGEYRVGMERIKEARAHVRNLGVKTRTFKESGGWFGFTSREQALKARLALDVEVVVDLDEIRAKLGI